MGGFDSAKVIDNYSVPDEYEPAVVLAIGRKASSDVEKTIKDLEVKRIPLNVILFENKFGNVHSILTNETITNN